MLVIEEQKALPWACLMQSFLMTFKMNNLSLHFLDKLSYQMKGGMTYFLMANKLLIKHSKISSGETPVYLAIWK